VEKKRDRELQALNIPRMLEIEVGFSLERKKKEAARER